MVDEEEGGGGWLVGVICVELCRCGSLSRLKTLAWKAM